jgi:hypothetical protein
MSTAHAPPLIRPEVASRPAVVAEVIVADLGGQPPGLVEAHRGGRRRRRRSRQSRPAAPVGRIRTYRLQCRDGRPGTGRSARRCSSCRAPAPRREVGEVVVLLLEVPDLGADRHSPVPSRWLAVARNLLRLSDGAVEIRPGRRW